VNPIHDLATQVADLVDIRLQRAELESREKRILATLREAVATPEGLAEFRHTYTATLTTAEVAGRPDPLPLAEFIADVLDTGEWPDKAVVSREASPHEARQVLADAWPRYARVEIALADLAGANGGIINCVPHLCAVPGPKVGAILRAAGHPAYRDLPTRIDFRLKPGQKGADHE
jgi:hypothetical protein